MKVFMKVTATVIVECSEDYATKLKSDDLALEVSKKWFKNNRRVVTKATSKKVTVEDFIRACDL